MPKTEYLCCHPSCHNHYDTIQEAIECEHEHDASVKKWEKGDEDIILFVPAIGEVCINIEKLIESIMCGGAPIVWKLRYGDDEEHDRVRGITNPPPTPPPGRRLEP